jgi:hypothetical protein
MHKWSMVVKVSAALVLLFTLGSLSAVSAQSSAPAAGTITSNGGCASRQIATVGNSSAVYYAPNPQNIVLGTILLAGSSFYVCTDVTVNGWTAFEITVPGTVLFVPAGTFAGFGTLAAPSSGAASTVAIKLPTLMPHPIPSPTASTLTVGTGTFGTCATFTYRPVVRASAIYFAPDPKSLTGLILQPGSSFAVCTDSNIKGWTAFQITIPGTILYAPAGTFAG